MPRRLHTCLFAVGSAGALLMASSASGAFATESPPAVQVIDVEVGALEGRSLTGTVRCEPGMVVDVRASVSQSIAAGPDDRFSIRVEGEGGAAGLRCDPQATPFSAELAGDGVLVPGAFRYSVRATPIDVESTAGSAKGELPLEEEADLRVDRGPIPITISPVAGVSPEGPVAEGTITCDEPMSVGVRVGGWQEWAHVSGWQNLECDGTTAFAVPITSYSVQLLPGPASLSIKVSRHVSGPDESDLASIAFREVELRNATPEPDFRPYPTEDPFLDVGAVRRVEGRLEAGVTLPVPRCDPPWVFTVEAAAYPLRVVIDGRWYDPSRFSHRVSVSNPCEGDGKTVVRFPDAVGDGAVVLEFFMHLPRIGPVFPGIEDYAAFTSTPK